MSDSQNFLASFLDKIGNEIEYGTKTVLDNPGKALVGTVDTILAQNNPLNPTAYLNNAIRRGIGSSFLKGEGEGVLKRERDDEGRLKTNATDAFFLQNQDDVEKVGEKAITSNPKYAPLRNENMGARRGPNGKGSLYTSSELDAAATLLQDPKVQDGLALGATFDPTKTASRMLRDGQTASKEQTLKAQGVLNPDGTVKGGGTTDPTNLEGLQVLEEQYKESETKRKDKEKYKKELVRLYGPDAVNPDGSLKSESALQADQDQQQWVTELTNKYGPNAVNPDGTPKSESALEAAQAQQQFRTNLTNKYGPNAVNPDGSLKSESTLQIEAAAKDPNYLLNVAQVKQQDAAAQRDANIELAALDLKRVLGEGELDLSKLKLKSEVDIANQEAQWLNDKDLRDHEYKMKQQQMNQFDDIFKIIMSAGNMF